MHKQVTTLKTDRKAWTPPELLEVWHQHLQEKDRSAGTVKKYTQAVVHFLAWYEQEEHAPLTLEALTPIALIGYRNELQHTQHKSISTINLRISALRAWCGWMTEQGYLAADPAAHVKLVGGEGSSKRSGLKSAQVNALLRQAQVSRDQGTQLRRLCRCLLQTGHSLERVRGARPSRTSPLANAVVCCASGRAKATKRDPFRSMRQHGKHWRAYVAPRLGNRETDRSKRSLPSGRNRNRPRRTSPSS